MSGSDSDEQWRRELARLDRTEAVVSWLWWSFVGSVVLAWVLALFVLTPRQVYLAMRVPLSFPWLVAWALPLLVLVSFAGFLTRVAWLYDRRLAWLPALVAVWYTLAPGIVTVFVLYLVRWRVVHRLQVHSKAIAFQPVEQ